VVGGSCGLQCEGVPASNMYYVGRAGELVLAGSRSAGGAWDGVDGVFIFRRPTAASDRPSIAGLGCSG
jgi:hypothetical protein